jgi:hypothetical protein
MIFDSNGQLVNEVAIKTGKKIGHMTTRLMKRLLKEGMTAVEGRALIHDLQALVNISAIIELLLARCDQPQ